MVPVILVDGPCPLDDSLSPPQQSSSKSRMVPVPFLMIPVILLLSPVSRCPRLLAQAELKSRKAGEALRRAVDKYNAARADFEQRMLDSAMRFQEVEEAHLRHMKGLIGSYSHSVEDTHVQIGQVSPQVSAPLPIPIFPPYSRRLSLPFPPGPRGVQAERGEHRHGDAAPEVCREQRHREGAARSVGFRRVPAGSSAGRQVRLHPAGNSGGCGGSSSPRSRFSQDPRGAGAKRSGSRD
uniref:Uncharacterized protein n=1 Tax=Cyanistes caeruleus TaxID=156563 RepID=A0A8C0VDI3_CYACU